MSTKDLIVNFFPWAILQGFKNEKDSIFEKNAIEIIKPIIIEGMKNALPLPNDVPVEAEIGVGENWLEAH